MSELPKFPGEQTALIPPRRETPDTLSDRLRHAFPATLTLAVGLVAGFVGLGVALTLFCRAFTWTESELGRPAAVLLAVAPVFFSALPLAALAGLLWQRRRDRSRT